MFSLFYFHGELNSDPAKHTVQYPVRALKGIIFGNRITEEDRESILEVVLSKHYVSPMQQDFCFWEAEPQPNGSMYKRFYSPLIDWRQRFAYPRKG